LAPAIVFFRVLQAVEEERLGQHGRGGGAVAGHVARLRRRLLHHLHAQVLVLVSKLDLLGHGHAVLRHGRTAPTLLEHRVAAAGPQRAGDRAGQLDHALPQGLPSFHVKRHLFCHWADYLLFDRVTG